MKNTARAYPIHTWRCNPVRFLGMLLLPLSIWIVTGCTSPAKIRKMNRLNLNRLKIEMSREEVLAVMKYPYRSEFIRMPDGEQLELLFYHTDLKNPDGAITDDELTPVVLVDDKVVGWGWILLNRYRLFKTGEPQQQPSTNPEDIREEIGGYKLY